MHIRTLVVLFLLPAGGLLRGDMGPSIPDSFWAFGPSLGYTWSDNLSGTTIGFEALQSWAVFTYSAGAKYVFSDNDRPDFRGNNGLFSIYIEGTVALPFPLGIGASYNFALGSGSGPGLQLYWGIPVPLGRKFYASLFWRPQWIWINGNPETLHEIGVYFKRSTPAQKMDEAARRRYRWRTRFEKERAKRTSSTTNRNAAP